mmetsp:Transcript_10631/g.17892  ORF Transcript_10631/g.17892 Transcript_10631/m.17892 type:complete len:383 (+) Transcript_10631:63-1211(+)
MISSDTCNESGISDYERVRLDNIQRNESFLRNIGITPRGPSTSREHASTRRVRQKRSHDTSSNGSLEVGTRRSNRVSQLPLVNYKDEADFRSTASKDTRERDIIDKDIAVGTSTGAKQQLIKYEKQEKNNYASEFAKDIDANLSRFLPLFDATTSSSILKQEYHPLCVPVADYAKSAVMQMSVPSDFPSNREVRFSKYTGVAEWRNCCYLWVNIGGTSGYRNAFSEQGRHMMWYGGSRMKADSPSTLRLLTADAQNVRNSSSRCGGGSVKLEEGKSKILSSSSSTILAVAAASSSSAATSVSVLQQSQVPSEVPSEVPSTEVSPEVVVLFVRLEGGNYCCLGRVGWVACDLATHPVLFKWELLDWHHFHASDHFQEILRQQL